MKTASVTNVFFFFLLLFVNLLWNNFFSITYGVLINIEGIKMPINEHGPPAKLKAKPKVNKTAEKEAKSFTGSEVKTKVPNRMKVTAC